MFNGTLLKITSILAVLLLITSLVSSYLYLGNRDRLVELESQHTQLKQVLKECSERVDRVTKGGMQDDTLNVERENNLSILEDEKDTLLKKLSDLQNAKKCTSKQATSTENTNETIDVNANWDVDVQRLLDNTYLSNKRDSNPTP